MMLIGQIAKQEGPFWSADCEILGAFTQGNTRTEAAAMLAEVIELMVRRAGFRVTVRDIGQASPNMFDVLIDANQPGLLAAEVLKYQREKHRLSLADVAKKLGSANRTAYAAYEQGRREPSLSKYRELLAAVAPEIAVVVGPRSRPARPQRMTKRRPKAARRRRRTA